MKARLVRHPRLDARFTSTSRSWSDLMERVIAPDGGRLIKLGSHRSNEEPGRAVRHHLNICNVQPEPVARVRTADKIFANLAGFSSHICGSRH